MADSPSCPHRPKHWVQSLQHPASQTHCWSVRTPRCSAGPYLLCRRGKHKPATSTFSPPLATSNLLLRQNCRSLQHQALLPGVFEAVLLHCHCVAPALAEHCQPPVCTLLQGLTWISSLLPQLSPHKASWLLQQRRKPVMIQWAC